MQQKRQKNVTTQPGVPKKNKGVSIFIFFSILGLAL